MAVTELEELDKAVAGQMVLPDVVDASEIVTFCQQARGRLPLPFLNIHHRLDDWEQQATFRHRADRYRGRS